MWLIRFLLLSVLALFAARVSSAAPAFDIVYPRPESSSDPRSLYPEQLLRLALERSCPQCRMRPSSLLLMQNRALTELGRADGEVNIAWSMTSIEREQRLLPIRIPLDRGLLGWRILLLMPATETRLAAVTGLADLRRFSLGQEQDWPDTAILRQNQLNVQASAQYETLFKMLVAGRFELFPRSLIEIGQEARLHAAEGMVIDRYIVMHYPTAFYFFVNRGNVALAATVRRGLLRTLADGSFEALFQKTFGAQLKAARLENRRVIELANPLLPTETPVMQSVLWFRPRGRSAS
ncbi:hypothetical protein [Paludibacterium yongneupense]|uniref:hypothetical protein n=1 Tax=Paludibacterium yongneupense TaxID=400061 RepID=UPI0004262BD2|nr:hypothetical protein [Paludibacterium yongneupense]